MKPLRSTLHHARAASAVSGARPAYAAGFRAAIASVAPLVLGHLLHSSGGVWMSIAGLNGAFADNGGPYRTRARTMTILALASAVAIALGTLVAVHLVLAVAVTFALGALCSLARVWGASPSDGATSVSAAGR